MDYKEILNNFEKFFEIHKENSFKNLKQFFDKQKDIFYDNKIKELLGNNLKEPNNSLSIEDATIKARQGWISIVGRSLEKIIEFVISDFCNKHNLKITSDRILKAKKLNVELDSVKRAIIVNFGEYCVLPDADIIIYSYDYEKVKIIAILSIKNSFRERYTETPYWKLKLSESDNTKHIKVFMVTPDNDDEISYIKNIKKSRIVMEYELDGIYLAKDNFDNSKKIKSIDCLVNDIKNLL